MVDGRWAAATVGVLRYARERGIPAVVDVDRVGGTTDWDETFELATHLIVAEDALADLTGAADPADGVTALAAGTDACVAVTCGARGMLWVDGDGLRRLPAFEVEAVDTTAAGDVFHGACALALAEGVPVGAAFRFAAAAAAVKCTRAGARRGIPDRDAVRALLARRPAEVVA
jgi:sulfofructose kinase